MKPNQKIIAKASRIEFNSKEDRLYIVFEVVDQKSKQNLYKEWSSQDIEFKLDGLDLVENEENVDDE